MKNQIQLADRIGIVRLLNRRSPLQCRSGLNQAAVFPALMLLLLTATSALAGSATWNLNATSDITNWFNETNWTRATVPDGPDDTATFDVSNTTNVYPSIHLFLGKLSFTVSQPHPTAVPIRQNLRESRVRGLRYS